MGNRIIFNYILSGGWCRSRPSLVTTPRHATPHLSSSSPRHATPHLSSGAAGAAGRGAPSNRATPASSRRPMIHLRRVISAAPKAAALGHFSGLLLADGCQHQFLRPLSGGAAAAAAASSSGSLIHGIHVFRCPDSVGIVAKISECIASRGGNIHSVDVFVPHQKHIFYSRSEFVFDPQRWPRAALETDFLNIAKHFKADISTIRVPNLDPKYKIAVLSSKQDHCLVDLLHRWQEGRLPVEITCIISNHERASDSHVRRFLEQHNIPIYYLPTASENKREQEILELVESTDFLVLARYMQVLSPGFLKIYGKDIINIHHGLLPSFKGGNPARQAFDAGVKLIGATTHFVTEDLDEGAIIEQMVERVSHRDDLQSFVQKSENLEKQCLAKALKSYCELRVLPFELTKTVVF